MKNKKFKIGDYVKVKEGIMSPDVEDLVISGWQGRIYDITKDDNNTLVCIELDSITLKNLPDFYIENSEEEGLDYTRIHLWDKEVESAESRDTIKDREEVIKAISSSMC